MFLCIFAVEIIKENMFNKDFYPTPKEVIQRMTFDCDFNGKVVLEPSAGKGDIVDYLKECGAKEVLACEKNADLASVVGEKCQLIASDFLTVRAQDVSHVDYIIMNPPFSADETHILHAWEIAPEGCTIVSLCNANTIDAPYSYKRGDLIDVLELYGKREFFGECFSFAERKTGVSVACVWLYKPRTGSEEFTDYFNLNPDEENRLQAGLIQYNYVRDIVNRYVGAMHLFDKIKPLAEEINELAKPISEHGIKFGAYRESESNYTKITREVYKKELQKRAWHRLFEEMNMQKYVTAGVSATINKFVEQQVHVPFTMRNIYKMMEIIIGTHSSRMEQVVVEAFEKICSYSWRENCTGGERWKTNSDYVVNRKFIIPYVCEYRNWARHSHLVNLNYSRMPVDDIVKALCYLVGVDYSNCSSLSAFVDCNEMLWGRWYDWDFFRIRGYKKGTMHFEFMDEKVWELFNRRVAEIKGWRLPETTNETKAQRKRKTARSRVKSETGVTLFA
jgi:predicted RNA methylase